MSMTMETKSTTWASPVHGLWASSREGEFLGLVETSGASYLATGARGEVLGTFSQLRAAQEAVTLGGAA